MLFYGKFISYNIINTDLHTVTREKLNQEMGEAR